MNATHTCSICRTQFRGYGNNPAPLTEGKCCDDCNMRYVIFARICPQMMPTILRAAGLVECEVCGKTAPDGNKEDPDGASVCVPCAEEWKKMDENAK